MTNEPFSLSSIGQGAQVVGMAKDVYESSSAARKVFDEAEDALQMDLRRHIFNGPQV